MFLRIPCRFDPYFLGRRTTRRDSAGGGEDNLIHALLEWASTEEPSLLELGQDLPNVSSASRLSLDEINKEVRGSKEWAKAGRITSLEVHYYPESERADSRELFLVSFPDEIKSDRPFRGCFCVCCSLMADEYGLNHFTRKYPRNINIERLVRKSHFFIL